MGAISLMTAEEFLNLPDEPGKQELLDGEFISAPLAKVSHMHVIKRLFELLRTVLPISQVWVQTGYQLDRRGWLVPDVSVSWPGQPVKDGWMQGAPMVAIEVVSPANRPEHIVKKTAAYLDEGAAEIWMVHPGTPSMVIFRREYWERVTENYRSELLNVTIELPALVGPRG
jgi:Uma2 family endonuclease